MRAGALNSRVVLQSRTLASDAIGNPVETWSDVATEWADVEAEDGIEAIQMGQVNSRQVVKVTLRYRSGVNDTMRLTHAGKTYEIMSVVNVDQKNRELRLVCQSRPD